MQASRFYFPLLCFVTSTAALSEDPPKLSVDQQAILADNTVRASTAQTEKAEAEARKATAEAAAAAAKARFGDLAGFTNQGTTTAQDKAGQIEAAILSAASTRKLAARIIADVCGREKALCTDVAAALPPPPLPALDPCADLAAAAPGTVRLYIVGESDKPGFDKSETVQASLCGLARRLRKGLDDSAGLRGGGDGQVQSLAPAAIFTAANIIGNLFRSEYTVQGVTLTSDDLLLSKAVAAAAGGQVKVPVMLPALYRPNALGATNPLIASLATLDALRLQADAQATGDEKTAGDLAKKKGGAAKAKKYNEVAAELKAAVKAYDDYAAKLVIPSDKGVSDLVEAAQQMQIRNDLNAGAHLLIVKMNAAGGSTYTKKNFWTFLGGMPFYVSGGSAVSYALIDGRTGAIAGAGNYGAPGGFKGMGALHRTDIVQ